MDKGLSQEHLNLSGTESVDQVYESLSTISKRIVPYPRITTYKAEEFIVLTPGFQVDTGAVFSALIDTFPVVGLVYRYLIKDHLGNIRVEFKDNGSGTALTVSNHNYYPFGMRWEDSSSDTKNNYFYNGKELQKSFDLDYLNYGFRYYDPAIGHFTGVDPLADAPNLVSYSPYHYSYNNPINYIDPDGRSPIKGLKALFNVGRRAYKTYKKTGKFNAKTVGKGLKDELINIVDNASTLLDGNLNADDAFAAIDLVTGFGGEAKKLFKGADKAGDTKKVGTFKSDRDLPRNKDGTPDASADGAQGAHTQLGKKDGSKGTYNQAREFDSDGNVVKDIDFTDHGRPSNHLNPHEHPYVTNKTGGTPSRSKKSYPLNHNRKE